MPKSNKTQTSLSSTNKTKSGSKVPAIKKGPGTLFKKSSQPNRDSDGKFTSGAGGLRFAKKLNWRRSAPVIAVIALVGGLLVFNSFALSSATYNLKSYYPNTDIFKKQYLEGNNYISGKPVRSVLWFEPLDTYTFKMYNAAPQNSDRRCKYDVLSWWPDNTLRYSETSNACSGTTPKKFVYDAKSPMILLPATWDSSKPWKYSGKVDVKYYEADSTKLLPTYALKCTGVTTYESKIVGVEKITPVESALHWQTTQQTAWNVAASTITNKGCSNVSSTRWQQDYWLSDAMKSQGPRGTTSKGLRRSKGTGVGANKGQWDVWYDGWATLPKLAIDDTRATN